MFDRMNEALQALIGKRNGTTDAAVASSALHALADALANAAAERARHHCKAANPDKGMTIAELDHFIHAAMAAGADDQGVVMVRTAGPTIKLIWTTEPGIEE